MWSRWWAIASIIGGGLVVTGCATSESGEAVPVRAPSEFASRRLPDVTLEQAQTAADRVFRNHFRVDGEVSRPGRLISRPVELEGRSDTGTLGDRVRLTPARQRQIGELRVEPQSGAVVVQVSVLTQRLETTERASFSRERGDDRPNRTPINRAGPASVDRREEWRTIGRARPKEQAILDEVQAALVTETRPGV